MARVTSQTGWLKGIFAAVSMVIWVTAGPAEAAHAAPLLAQAGAALVAPDAAKAAKPANPVANVPGAKMAENFANAPAGGAPAAAAAAPASGGQTGGGSSSLMKYGPCYVLMAVLIGLGSLIICRP